MYFAASERFAKKEPSLTKVIEGCDERIALAGRDVRLTVERVNQKLAFDSHQVERVLDHLAAQGVLKREDNIRCDCGALNDELRKTCSSCQEPLDTTALEAVYLRVLDPDGSSTPPSKKEPPRKRGAAESVQNGAGSGAAVPGATGSQSSAPADAGRPTPRRRAPWVTAAVVLAAAVFVLAVVIWLVVNPDPAPVTTPAPPPAGPPPAGPTNPGGCFDPTFLASARSAGVASDLALAPLARKAVASVTAGADTSVIHENKETTNILQVCDRQCWLWSSRPETSPERAQLFQDMRDCFNRAAIARGGQPPAAVEPPPLATAQAKRAPKTKRTPKPVDVPAFEPEPKTEPGPNSATSPEPAAQPTPVVVFITSIQVIFHTTDDDKDRDDGISEALMQGSEILASNQSWGRGLVFRDNSRNLGQPLDVSARRLSISAINSLTYHWTMDNDDGWHVTFQVLAQTSDGRTLEVHRDPLPREIGNGGPRSGVLNLKVQ